MYLNCFQALFLSAKFDSQATWALAASVMSPKISYIPSMKFTCLWRASSQAAISTASCSDLTGLLETNSLLRCDGVSDERVAVESSLAIVEISEEGVYVVTVVMEVVAVVEAAAVLVAAVAESKLIAVEGVVKDGSKSMALLSAAAMSSIDVHIISVMGSWLCL